MDPSQLPNGVWRGPSQLPYKIWGRILPKSQITFGRGMTSPGCAHHCSPTGPAPCLSPAPSCWGVVGVGARGLVVLLLPLPLLTTAEKLPLPSPSVTFKDDPHAELFLLVKQQLITASMGWICNQLPAPTTPISQPWVFFLPLLLPPPPPLWGWCSPLIRAGRCH